MLNIDKIVKLSLYINYAAATATMFDSGLILGDSTVISTTTRVKQYASAADMLADGFDDDDPEYLAALIYFNQDPAPASVYVGVKGNAETLSEALLACFEAGGDFWGIYVCGLSAADALTLTGLLGTQNRGMLFFAQTGTVADAIVADGPLDNLYQTKSRRVFAMLGNAGTDAVAVLGRVVGLNNSHRDNAFSLCYKDLSTDVSVRALTQTNVDAVKALNASVYVTRGYYHKLLENGATPSGLRVDESMYLDMIIADIQDACFNLIANNDTKLPQSDETSTLFINTISSVLDNYVSRGVLGEGIWRGAPLGNLNTGDAISGYTMYVDSFYNQSTANRQAHKAMPITIALSLSGSVETIELEVYAQQ